MKTLLFSLVLLGSISAFANERYDYREQSEIHCSTPADSKVKLDIVIQNETKMGFTGYPISNDSKVKVELKGKIDGKNLNINEKFSIGTKSKSRLAIARSFKVSNSEAEVSNSILSDLTDDETTPGQSTKVSVKGLVSGFGEMRGIVNIVHGQGQGFASLNIETEHFVTLPVTCVETQDSADQGQNYFVNFQ